MMTLRHNYHHCHECHQGLFFRYTKHHQLLPLDTMHVPGAPDGSWVVVDGQFARPAEPNDVGVSAVYMDHRLTCPNYARR